MNNTLQTVMQMKKQLDSAASAIAKISPQLDSIERRVKELKVQGEAEGVMLNIYFSWHVYEIERIDGQVFPDPDQWQGSNC